MGKKAAYSLRFSGLWGVSEIGGDFLRDRVTDWQRWLRHAQDNKHTTAVTCQYLPPEGDGVKRHERQTAIYTTDVVKADDDGVFVIRLPTGLQKKYAGEEKTAVPHEDGILNAAARAAAFPLGAVGH
ncbi:hypothetical protein [Pantoea sp. App145]|uniref:hypothetical protein n=1 Tax=Pantoea sp. App145 TaxID=3071567 RepID=UPI003A80305A